MPLQSSKNAELEQMREYELQGVSWESALNKEIQAFWELIYEDDHG